MPDAGTSDTRSERAGKPSPDAIRRQLDHMLESQAFQSSPKRRALLRFIVEETLSGRADRIKGFTVATEVFGRDATFDAQNDPVVRLEARRLRRDIDSYYGLDGRADPIRIAIPKGGYVPVFEWLHHEPLQPPPAPDHLPPMVEEPLAPADTEAEPTADGGRAAGAGEAAGGRAGPPGATPASRGRRPLARLAMILAPVVLLVAGAAVLAPQLAALVRSPANVSVTPSIMVLPFEAIGPADDNRYLASGMTLELIRDLMRFADFRLFSVPASFRQAASTDPTAVASALPVSYIVDGAVQTSGDSVRVAARLLHAETGEILWSETYDRPATPRNLLELQDELADRIATALGQPYGALNRHAADAVGDVAAPTATTYACILRAYEYRRTFNVELHAPTLACLQASVVRDPEYADAWAFLAWLQLDAVRYRPHPEANTAADYRPALDAARRAVALDENSTRALQAMSAITYYIGDFEAAERIQRRALALNPSDPETLVQLGWRLAARGKWDEGLGYVRKAIDRTVNPPGWYFQLPAIHDFLAGRYAESLAGAERSGLQGSSIGLALMAVNQAALGDMTAAKASLDTLARIDPDFFRNPEAALRVHQGAEATVDGLMAGLVRAGWTPPRTLPKS